MKTTNQLIIELANKLETTTEHLWEKLQLLQQHIV